MVDSVEENNGSTNKPLCSVAVLQSSGLLDGFLSFLGALLAGRLRTPAGVACLAAGRLEPPATLALEAMSA